MKKFFEGFERFFDNLCAPRLKNARVSVCLAFNLLATLAMIFLPSMTICDAGKTRHKYITAWGALDSGSSESSFYMLQVGALAAIAACFIALIFLLFKGIVNFSNEDAAVSGAKLSVIVSSVAVVIYTTFTFVFSPINRLIGGYSTADVSYAALVYMVIIDILFAVLIGSVSAYRKSKEKADYSVEKLADEERRKLRLSLLWRQLEAQVFAFAMGTVAIVALMSKLITVVFDESLEMPDYVINGTKMLFKSGELETKGERTVSFLIFALFVAVVAGLVMSLTALISRSAHYSKFAVSSIAISGVTCGLVGLFGQYYKVVQTLNTEMVDKLLSQYGIEAEELLLYNIKSGSMTYLYIALGVLLVFILLKPVTKTAEIERKLNESSVTLLASSARIKTSGHTPSASGAAKGSGVAASSAAQIGFDPCPAFTEIDEKRGRFSAELSEKRRALFENPTLPALVNFIVQYARDCDHHLFYTPETVATFLAGLGATRLTILQGMSGTGKTSLPKIVAEALMSVCDIVEVESAWRDKNELLGYYNEFNKVYTPKKFTQALYRASLNSDTLTFIVLDEMNLSRIEYYFSDFLSLMEHDPDKREIKLLNTPLAKTDGDVVIEYSALEDGHTLKIPQNVWFIGTANRDESTYDISDKVYDRAHTMNFDKRAQKPTLMGDPIPQRYLPASELIRMFNEAKANIRIDIDKFPVVKRTEELLEPYGISFGNRISMQIESFVSVYASCFAFGDSVIHDAFDTILLSKVVKKLELKIVDDKEALASEFAKAGLEKCSKFIMSLRED